MNLLSVRREVGEFRKRYKWMALVVVLSFFGIYARLIQLQLIEGETWLAEAQRNITKRTRLPATRGLILDRQGRVAANNRPAYNVYLTPQLLRRSHIARIAELMQLSVEERQAFEERLAKIPARRRNHLIEMFTDIDRDQYGALQTHAHALPGLQVVDMPVRVYPFGELASHALGFLNEVSAEDLERLTGQGYRAGHRIGRAGVERAWESYLRGRDGELHITVDVRGREFAPDSRMQTHVLRHEPTPGRNLVLTLDMDIMRSLRRAFRGHPSGGAVVVDIHTGRIRALYSKPAIDPNELSGRLSVARAQEIENNPFRPLIDKTLYETYFPGSTFKPFSALVALEDKLIDTNTRINCPGYYELGRRRFRCSHVHHEVDMQRSLVQSCNVYFYKLAEMVGIDRLARVAKDFGLGERTGLGINTEAAGFIPTRDWYEKNYQRYRVGFALNAAIGQGNTRVSLIQLAMAYAALANGGMLYTPQLVQRIETPAGEVIEEFPPRVRRRISADPENIKFIARSMHGVVNDQKGTAAEAKIEGGVPVIGKTGTAQVSQRGRRHHDDAHRAWFFRRSHAWFAGFAPADNPELAIVVLVEHGGQGGKYAAPIAVQVLQEALGDQYRAAQATAATPQPTPAAAASPRQRPRRQAQGSRR